MIRSILRPRRLLILAASTALVLLGPEAVAAQQAQLPGTGIGQQSLRPYWHVFVAYAIVIALIGGWAFSIARRLRGIEDRLVD